ncbi:MAG: hypothetical protein NVS3B10_08420 [Polyangiales bacterium]
MLPPFIIEQIRKREEERRQDNRAQPHLELPIPPSAPRRQVPEDDADRGVTIIELG